MKASIRLREEENKLPLLRVKVPVSIFSLPFAASATAGDPSDIGLHLLSSFPSFPSLKLSYHPNPTNPNNNPFTLTLKSGAGHLGSPANSPFQISFHLSANPNPTFSFSLKPHLGHFSLSKTSSSLSPSHPKENGGEVHHPIPMVASLTQRGIDELVSGGVGVRVRTAVPMGPLAGLKVRWAVKLPPESTNGSGVFGRLPFLTLDKISIETRKAEEEQRREEKKSREWSSKDFEAMKGMCFWMGREVEEMRKESGSIKESMEAVKMKFSEVNSPMAANGRIAGGFPATAAAVAKRQP